MELSKGRYSRPVDEFKLWLEINSFKSFYLRGHKFEKKKNSISIDGGVFSREEAIQLFEMIISSNPFTRINATLIIWGRNGDLTKILVILSILFLILMYIEVIR